MSWDFFMMADLGGPDLVYVEEFEAEQTYNVAPMYFEAFGDDLFGVRHEGEQPERLGIRGLNGKTGEAAKPLIELAIQRMTKDPAKYRAMEPDNGWGSYEGAMKTLNTLNYWCCAAPRGIIKVT